MNLNSKVIGYPTTYPFWGINLNFIPFDNFEKKNYHLWDKKEIL